MSTNIDLLIQYDVILWTLISIVLLILIIPKALQRKHLIESSKKLPGPPVGKNHPYPWLQELGTFKSLPSVPERPHLRIIPPWLMKQYMHYSKEENGGHGLFRIWAFNPFRIPFARCMVHVFDPNLANDILSSKSYGKFSKGHVYELASPLVGDSMLTLDDGVEWKRQRKIASSGFGHAVLEYTTEVATNILRDDLFPKWDVLSKAPSKQSADMVQYMLRFTLDVIGEVAFSYSFQSVKNMPHDIDKEKDDTMYDTFNTLIEILMVRYRSLPFQSFLPSKLNRKFKAACNKLNLVVNKIVTDRTKEQEMSEKSSSKGHKKWKDLLSQLLIKDDSGNRLSHKFISGNIRMFLFAGHDTTAMTLSYCLWHLATNHNIQEELYNEILPLFISTKNNPTYKDLRNLKLLDAIMKETLRINAPAGISRRAIDDVIIGNKEEGKNQYLIPKGCEVYIYPHSLQRHPKYWDNPDIFDPSRFLSLGENNNKKDNIEIPGPFIPFSVGPRNCIGLQLAMAEIRATIAHIIFRYKLKPFDDKKQPYPIFMMTIGPHEVLLSINSREK